VTHPADHFSRAAIGHAIDWFQATLEGAQAHDPRKQVWYWKELGNLVALIGMVVLLFAVGATLLEGRFFPSLGEAPSASRGAQGASWWGAALLFTALPALTLFPFKDVGAALPVSALFPQSITNQVMIWALLTGAISLALFALWHLTAARSEGTTSDDYGLTWEGRVAWSRIGASFLLALGIVLAAYTSLAISAAVFTVDYRFWVFAVKPMSGLHFRMALLYLPAFVLFFGVYGMVLCGQLRQNGSTADRMVRAIVLSTLGFVSLIGYQYTPLFLGGTLALPSEPLWSIIALQFLPLMTIVAAVSVYFHQRTGHIYVGAFVSGMLVTWIVVTAALPEAMAAQTAAGESEASSPADRYEALSASGDYAGLVELWAEVPDAAVQIIDGDLEGSLAFWEEEGEARRSEIDALIARAVRGAEAATEATGRRRILDYVTSFAGWTTEQKATFRAGQKACGEGRRALAADDAPTALEKGRACRTFAEPLGDWWGTAMGLHVEGSALAASDDDEGAVSALARGRLIYRELGLTSSALRIEVELVPILTRLGREPRAQAMIRDGIATAERLGLDEVAAGFRALEAERAGRIPNS